MDDITLVSLGLTVGICIPIVVMLAWWTIRDEYQRYTDKQIREAKDELREYAREHGGNGR